MPAQVGRFLLVFYLCYSVRFGLLWLLVRFFRWSALPS